MLKIKPIFDLMINSGNIKLKLLIAKCLLISTLVVSLFASSVSVGQSVLQQQKARTELVSSSKAKLGYRTVTYQIWTAQIRTPFIYGNSRLHTYHLLAYGKLSKIRFDQLLRQSICLKTCNRFHRLKIIPQDTGEDPSDCFIA